MDPSNLQPQLPISPRPRRVRIEPVRDILLSLPQFSDALFRGRQAARAEVEKHSCALGVPAHEDICNGTIEVELTPHEGTSLASFLSGLVSDSIAGLHVRRIPQAGFSLAIKDVAAHRDAAVNMAVGQAAVAPIIEILGGSTEVAWLDPGAWPGAR